MRFGNNEVAGQKRNDGSDEIAKRDLYRQKRCGFVHGGQIPMRAIKYPRLFEFTGRDMLRLVLDAFD